MTHAEGKQKDYDREIESVTDVEATGDGVKLSSLLTNMIVVRISLLCVCVDAD